MANWKWMVGALAAGLWLAPAAAAERGATQQGTSGQETSGQETSGQETSGQETSGQETSGQATSGRASSRAGGKQLTNAEIRDLSMLHWVNEDEIAAGNWMKDHATKDEVKSFAKKMVDDHSKLDQNLTSFAQDNGVDLTAAKKPASAEKESRELDQLKTMSGTQADRRYMRMMVMGHEQALKQTRAAEHTAKRNKPLASLFGDSAKKISEHLKDARKIEKDLTQRQARMPKR